MSSFSLSVYCLLGRDLSVFWVAFVVFYLFPPNMVRYTVVSDFKEPIIFIRYRWIYVIANIENEEKIFKGRKNGLC